MIEPEMAFYDLTDNMDLAEEFIKYTLQHILDHCKKRPRISRPAVDPGGKITPSTTKEPDGLGGKDQICCGK